MPRKMARVKGVAEVRRNLRRLGKAANAALGEELFREAEEQIMGPAKLETPVDTGALRASGHVRPPVVDAGRVTVVAGFGGPAGVGNVGSDTNEKRVGYAFWVHEREGVRHHVGKAKFLEDPARRAVPGMPARIAARLEARIRRAAGL